MHPARFRAVPAVTLLVLLLNGEEIFQTCGDGRCLCAVINADCSGRLGKHTYIAAFSEDITFLDFSDNGLTIIYSDDFFLNVTNISSLRLHENGLVNVSVAAFKSLKTLRYLDLDENKLTSLSLVAIFSVSTLIELHLSGNRLDSLPEGIFYSYPMQELRVLFLRDNEISRLNMTELWPLVQLQVLSLNNNHISDNIFPDYLPRLDVLDLGANGIFTFPETCTHSASSLFPNLTHLEFGGNSLRTLPQHICLPSLNYIDLSGNRISVLESGMFGHRRFPALQRILLNSMQVGIKRIEKDAFRNLKLQAVDMKFYFNREGKTLIESGAFAGCPNLRNLALSWVNFGSFNDHQIQLLFQHMENLRMLSLEFTGISQLTTNTFKRLKSLEEVRLGNNKITTLPDGVFDSLKNLTKLSLSHNQIATVRETTFSAATRRRLVSLTLYDNPFKCDCDLRWFQEWLRSDPSLFRLPHYEYECDGSLLDKNIYKASTNTNEMRQGRGRAGIGADKLRIDKDRAGMDEDRAKDNNRIIVDNRGRRMGNRVIRNKIGRRADKNGMGMDEYGTRRSYLYDPPSPSTHLRLGHFGGQRINEGESTASSGTGSVSVVSFYVPDQACLLSPENSRLIVISVSFPMVMFTSFLLLYSYRWHIRLLLYDAFRGKGDRRRRLQEQNFDYDVFVSYDSDDRHWVYHTLTPVLENDLGLRVCLHNRDFIPGKHILSNIVDCVESSKKIMAVFSTNFATSPWCQFELTLCLSHVMEHDDALLIVMLHDIPARDMTPEMIAVMKTTTYIQWADEPEARASFWGRVRIALNEIIPGV